MKTNFKISKTKEPLENKTAVSDDSDSVTPEEFEEFMIKSGAAGSFMIFRSNKKEDELGLEEL